MSQELIQSAYSHYIIIGCSVGGLVWGGVNAMFVNKVELKAEDIRVNDDKPSGDNLTKEQIQELELFPWD